MPGDGLHLGCQVVWRKEFRIGMPFDQAAAVHGLFLYGAYENGMDSTTSHAEMTNASTAPAVILAFSFVV
jgi:hypothetical protein